MKTVKEILADKRENVINLLNLYFSDRPLKDAMIAFLSYCEENGFNETSSIGKYAIDFRKQETAFAGLCKSNDINDLTSSIRKNTRNKWGI